MRDTRQQPGAGHHKKARRVEIQWTAVTYHGFLLYSALLTVILVAIIYLIRPDFFLGITRRLTATINAAAPTTESLALRNQARFVNLDGKVEVKKVNSLNWETADYHTTLDKGDLVRTAADGAARITFVDGTTYTIKSDSFVTVEQNSVDRDKTTRVAVHIRSGAVDLATGSWQSPRSKAEVSFANARASLHENSRAAVRSDRHNGYSEITVSAGAANMKVGGQQMEIGKWERAALGQRRAGHQDTVLAPPESGRAIESAAIDRTRSKARAAIHFAWSAVPDAVSYELRVSTNSMFTRVVAEKRAARKPTWTSPASIPATISGTSRRRTPASARARRATRISSLWSRRARHRKCCWKWIGTELHGNVVELIGRTEPGAALIINGETVADIRPDGHFRYFTQPMARGSHEIVITGRIAAEAQPSSACRLSYRKRVRIAAHRSGRAKGTAAGPRSKTAAGKEN